MNWTLLRSPWAIGLTVLTLGAFVGWWLSAGIDPGRGPAADTGFLLWSGWVAVALYLAVVAYVARKYVHRILPTPTRKALRPLRDKVEKATVRLQQVEGQVLTGVLEFKKDVESKVQAILREEGVTKLLKVDVLTTPAGQTPPFLLDIRSPEPRKRVLIWLHAHLYLGLGAALLVLLHGGGVWTTPMGLLLNGFSLFVTLSGAVGVWYWAVGPARLTRAEGLLSVEEAYSLEEHFGRKVKELLDPAREFKKEEQGAEFNEVRPVWKQVAKLFGGSRRPERAAIEAALAPSSAADKALLAEQGDLVILLHQHQRVRRELSRLMRAKRAMGVWRLAHVPASVLLVGLLVFHVFSVWWY